MRRLAVAAALLVAAPAARADTIESGVVVKIELPQIYVTLGEDAGAQAGARLRIKRPIELAHPVTRRKVRDWLPVGTAEISFAGEHLSMATLADDLIGEVKPGDRVEVYVEREEASARPPPEEPPPDDEPEEPPPDDEPDAPLPEVDEDTRAVLAVWTSQRGGSLDARIAAWEGYLSAHGDSPHAEAVRVDLVQLRELRDRLAPPSVVETRMVGGATHAAPTLVEAGVEVPLVFVLDHPEAVRSAWLHFRTTGAVAYDRVLLERELDLYLRGTIPAVAVAAPGVEYFLEVVDTDGQSGIAIAPTTVEVEREGILGQFTPARPRTRIATVATWMDFATFDGRDGDHADSLYQLEVDVDYGLDGALARLATGFGLLHGRGGRIDPAPDARDVDFQYGYAETEVRLGPGVGVAARLIAGLDRSGLAFGFEGQIRFGHDLGTNLTVAASQLAHIGYLTDIRLQVTPLGRVPIGFSVGATDRPVQGDPAVCLGLDVEPRAQSGFAPRLRLTYQGRTVEHSGLGVGLGLSFGW